MGSNAIQGLRVAIGIAAVALLGLAFSAAPAAAQLPAICDEYPDLPVCSEDAGGGPDDDGSDDDVGGTGSGGGPAGGDGGGGELPFTGYPLSWLLILMLILLAAGIALRVGLALKERLAERGATTQPPG